MNVFTMCQRKIRAVLAGTGDNQAPENRNSGENTIGIDVDAPTMTASSSTENNKPSLIAKPHGEDSSNDSKGSSNSKDGGKDGDETSSGNESKEAKAQKEKMAKIQKRAKAIEEGNKKRHEAAKAKGNVYQVYDPNEMNEY